MVNKFVEHNPISQKARGKTIAWTKLNDNSWSPSGIDVLYREIDGFVRTSEVLVAEVGIDVKPKDYTDREVFSDINQSASGLATSILRLYLDDQFESCIRLLRALDEDALIMNYAVRKNALMEFYEYSIRHDIEDLTSEVRPSLQAMIGSEGTSEGARKDLERVWAESDAEIDRLEHI